MSSHSLPQQISPPMEYKEDTIDGTTPPTSPRVLPPIDLPLPMMPYPAIHFPPTPLHTFSSPPPLTHLSPPSGSPTTKKHSKTTKPVATKTMKRTTADDREHHRRLSHSAIEKRRRERINDKIDQLKHLIPSCCPSPDTLPSASMHQPLHKLSVLQAAIDYIHQLHSQLVQQHEPSLSLSSALSSSTSSSSVTSSSSSSSLEKENNVHPLSSDLQFARVVAHARRQHQLHENSLDDSSKV
ncbi:uncharacterized protein BX664DRAFT_359673 [Halteromyces radiatus]|uniref:uncharacterized protein n=1 Tax=Halteromyces radiatus TaxID=101107 RepID=UPI00222105F6|nr:uncharacterized protein BX664DRAFT_359673 [Halteromyces radiatus]KAI8086119.1 hypothetical protein BX664DRAFT_359673 [Halteromyces radiatus]